MIYVLSFLLFFALIIFSAYLAIPRLSKRTYKKNRMNTSTKSENKFNFLEDKPINLPKNLKYGHNRIVDSLLDQIKIAPKNFNIGLVGGWGTGKSSIIDSMESCLPRDTKMFKIDLWNYEGGDSLRRAILQSISLEVNENLDERILAKKTARSVGKFNLDIKYILIWIALLVICTIAIYSLKNEENLVGFLNPLLTIVLSISFLKIVTDAIYFRPIITYEPFKDPFQFQNEFLRILERSKIKNGYNKVIMVFDNIDRVESKKAKEILGAIKTYIISDKKSVHLNLPILINLIPLDLQELILNEQEIEMDIKYFNKIFNTYIHIPSFESIDLELHLKELTKDIGLAELKDNGPLNFIISHGFKDNPRQIIHFLNVLASNLSVAKEREEKSENEFKHKDPRHIATYARLLVIKMKFLNEWKIIEENNLALTSIAELEELFDSNEYKNKFTSEFKDFARITKDFVIVNPRSWSNLRFTKFGEITTNPNAFKSQLLKLLPESKIEDFDILNSIDYTNQNSVDIVLSELFRDIKDEANNIQQIKMINSLLILSLKKNILFDEFDFNRILNSIKSNGESLRYLDVPSLFKYASDFDLNNPDYFNMLDYLFYLESEEDTLIADEEFGNKKSILKYFVKSVSSIDELKCKDYISYALVNRFIEMSHIDLIVDHRPELLSSELLSNLYAKKIGSLASVNDQTFELDWKTLLDAADKLDQKELTGFIEGVYFNLEHMSEHRKIKFWNKSMSDLLILYLNKFGSKIDKDHLEEDASLFKFNIASYAFGSNAPDYGVIFLLASLVDINSLESYIKKNWTFNNKLKQWFIENSEFIERKISPEFISNDVEEFLIENGEYAEYFDYQGQEEKFLKLFKRTIHSRKFDSSMSLLENVELDQFTEESIKDILSIIGSLFKKQDNLASQSHKIVEMIAGLEMSEEQTSDFVMKNLFIKRSGESHKIRLSNLYNFLEYIKSSKIDYLAKPIGIEIIKEVFIKDTDKVSEYPKKIFDLKVGIRRGDISKILKANYNPRITGRIFFNENIISEIYDMVTKDGKIFLLEAGKIYANRHTGYKSRILEILDKLA